MKLISAIKQNINDYSKIRIGFENKHKISFNTNPYESIINLSLEECRKTLSIIIPSYNTSSEVLFTLESIKHSTFTQKFNDKLEVIIVDDGSVEELYEQLKSYVPNFTLKIVRQNNIGRPQALNTGSLISKNDVMLFCDSDVILLPKTLEEIMARHLFSDDAFIFGFRNDERMENLDIDKLKEYMYSEVPKFWEDNRFRYDFANSWATNMMLETNMLSKRKLPNNIYLSDEVTSTDEIWQTFRMAYGFLISIDRGNFLKIDGYDESFIGWGWDDTCFCAKAASIGLKLIPLPSAHIVHIYHEDRNKNKWKEYKNNRDILNGILNKKLTEHVLSDIKLDERITNVFEFEKLDYNVELKIDRYNAIIEAKLADPQFFAEYHFCIGNIETALDLYKHNLHNLNTNEFNNLYDCILRLNLRDEYNLIKSHQKCFHFFLCEIFFNDNYLSIQETLDINTAYLLKFDSCEHFKRAKLYFKENQYLLAFKDFCAAYFRGNKAAKYFIKVCKDNLIKDY